MTTTSDPRLRFDEALRLARDGSPGEAVRELKQLLEEGHSVKSATGVIGLILYYDMHDPVGALPFLLRSVQLSPNTEHGSLALFHALLELDRVDEAFDEARRFLSNNKSDAYDEFIKGINSIPR